MLRNGEIADLFDLLGDLYELDGAVVYRVLAYRRAAKRMRETPESVWRLSEEGRLTELPDIGATIAGKVDDLRTTGSMPALEKLRAKYPDSMSDLVRLPGLGAKSARRLYDELGITNLEQLSKAIDKEQIRGLKGFSARTEERLREQLAAGTGPRKNLILLERALELMGTVLEPLRAHPACVDASEAGSLRRRVEAVGDIDLIASSEEPRVLVDWLCGQQWVAEVVGRGDTKGAVMTHDGVQVDLRVVPPDAWGNLLQHFTGSKAHNVAMREVAAASGLKVSEWGIETVETGEVFRTRDEDEVYRRLGYEPISPELRENQGELAAARNGDLPELVEAAELRGDLHTHTDASDGKAPLARMAKAARDAGLEYLAVTDHSAGVGMGIGLEAGDLLAHVERVREFAASAPEGLVVLAGAEVDVMADGSLYYPDDLLAELDWVVASLHVGQRAGSDRITSRLLAAVEHPSVDVLGHPSGRLIGRREGYDFDVERVVARAAECGTFLEINCQPDRLDLRPSHARLALAAGAKLVISTDAHRPASFSRLALGAAMARRAWATAEDVVNTRPWPEVQQLRKAGRQAVGA
jgi:DNA polymerase (family 10)